MNLPDARSRCAYCKYPLHPSQRVTDEDGDIVCADAARCGTSKRRAPVTVTATPTPDAAPMLTLGEAATLAEADAIALLQSIRAFKRGGHRGVTVPDEAFDRARASWHAYRRAALAGGPYDRVVNRFARRP